MLLARQAILAQVILAILVLITGPIAMRVGLYGWGTGPIGEVFEEPVPDCDRKAVTDLFAASLHNEARGPVDEPPRSGFIDDEGHFQLNYHQLVDHCLSVFYKGYELRGHITEVVYMSGLMREEINPIIYVKLVHAEFVGEESRAEQPTTGCCGPPAVNLRTRP